MSSDGLDSLPDGGQVACVAYYRARAPEYGVTARVDQIAGRQLRDALEAFSPRGRVLELSCDPGMSTVALAKHASELTVVDARPGLLRLAAARVQDERVRFIESDIFAWEPDGRYDVVFFSAWLSYVPPQRFGRFWALVADCLKPEGRVFFVDQLPACAHEQALHEALIPVVERALKSEARDRAVKVFYEPDELRNRLAELGWSVAVYPRQQAAVLRHRAANSRLAKHVLRMIAAPRVHVVCVWPVWPVWPVWSRDVEG